MGNDAKKGSFGQFINQIKAIFLGFFGFVSAVAGFITLAQGNTGLITLILLGLGGALLWLACLYFARFWKPETDDGKTGLILPSGNDKAVKQQRKKEERRRLVRRLALVGLVLVPLSAMGSFGAWQYVQNLPNDDVVILVADFDGPDTQNNRVTETILRQLRDATSGYDDVEVIALGQTVSEQAGSDEARKLADKKKADILIWGWYGQTADTVPISANFEILETNEYLPDDLGDSATGAIQTFDIAELDGFTLQTRLSNEMSFLTLFTLGLADYAAKEWDSAIDRFDNALIQNEQPLESFDLSFLYFYKGTAHFYNQAFELALKDFDQALKIKPDNYQVLYNKGSALSELEQYNEAIRAYDQALKIKPNDPDTLNNKGNALADLGRYDKAMESFEQLLSIKPDDPDALNNKGIVLANLGQFDKAIETYEQALSIKPNLNEAFYNKGNALYNLGQYEKAIESYEQALKIKPDDYATLNRKGMPLVRLGQYEKAIESFEQALKIKPDYHLAIYNKGIALYHLEQYDDAINSFEQALKIKPDHHLALTFKGISLSALGRYNDAINAFDLALKIKPDNHTALYNKACTYNLKGDTENTLRFLQEAIALNENYRDLTKTNSALNNIRQDPRFQKLINADS